MNAIPVQDFFDDEATLAIGVAFDQACRSLRAVLCLSVVEARNCFGDETGYSLDCELSDQNRPRFGRHSK
jgi:hypothetical protein